MGGGQGATTSTRGCARSFLCREAIRSIMPLCGRRMSSLHFTLQMCPGPAAVGERLGVRGGGQREARHRGRQRRYESAQDAGALPRTRCLDGGPSPGEAIGRMAFVDGSRPSG